MIPTSGLGKSPSDGVGYSTVNYIGTTPQQITGDANRHFYKNMSGQMCVNNMQWKNSFYGLANGSMNCRIHMAENNQNLMNAATTNPVVPLSGNGYAMNAADLAGSGNLYGPVSYSVLPVAPNLNGKSFGLQSTKMIPVPRLPSQQQILPALQQYQQNQSQKMSSPHGLSFLPKGGQSINQSRRS
ncbi:hypothetical protein SUGI_0463370 [Cryptomeria japonica]|nr:hypothetical protein SUGI_0463370 [Cryptomeria japonica]